MRHFLPVHALLAAATLLAADPAHGRATASVTLADFRIELTDLDPSDGVAPWLTLDPQSHSVVEVTLPSDVDSHANRGDSAFDAVSTSRESDGSQGSASFSGDPFGAGAVLAVSAVGDHGGGATSDATVDGPASVLNLGDLVLGPRSEVTFSGSASLDWYVSNPRTTTYTVVGVTFFQQLIDGGERFAGQDYLSMSYIGFGELTGSLSGPIELSFANASDAPVVVIYSLGARADAGDMQIDPLPVDEPAGAVLLLAGVPWLLWRARRSR
jgi:hypothetical protein